MANTQLALPTDIPAYIRAAAEKNAENNRAALGGIRAGSFPRLSIGGSKFSIVENGIKTLLMDADKTDLPAMELEVVVVGFNSSISKLYFEGEYQPGDDKEPACSSDNGIVPDPHIQNPQGKACASCPKNIWGSKITPQGKQVKACSDNKRLVVIFAHDLNEEQALDLTIKPGSLKNWAEYVRALDAKGISVQDVVTKVRFEGDANFPKVVFKFGRFLTEEEMAIAAHRALGDDVRLITSPRQTTATVGVAPVAPAPAAVVAPAPTPVAPAPVAVVAPAPTPVAPAPVAVVAPAAPAPVSTLGTAPASPAPTLVDPYAGLPVHVKLAVDAAGGLGSDIGKGVYKSLAGKDAPAAKEPETDPFEGLASHVKLAVDAAGGLGTPGGDQVYAALSGKPAKAKRGRPAKAPSAPTATPAPFATAAVAGAPLAAAPQSFVTPPQASAGGLGSDLDALLAAAMKV